MSSAAVSVSRSIAQNAVQFGQDTLQWFVSLGLTLYLAFFMLRDGSELVALLARALPMWDDRELLLFSKFAEVTRATVKGTLGGIIF